MNRKGKVVLRIILCAAICLLWAVWAGAGENTPEPDPPHAENNAGEDPPELDLRNVKLAMRDGELTGEISYTLVVGTFFEWNTDPRAVPGLFSEVDRRTKIKTRVDFTPVSLDSEEIFANPFLIMTGNRFFSLADEEVANLRRYALAGGFIYADDCGGADWSFRQMIGKIFPERKLEEVRKDHPIFKGHYKLSSVPKILDLYGTEPKGLGVFIDGRLAVFYTYDTDVPCGWEKYADGSFVHLLTPEKHNESFELGVNIVVHALRDLYERTLKGPREEKANDDSE